jgi:hypothetical protein
MRSGIRRLELLKIDRIYWFVIAILAVMTMAWLLYASQPWGLGVSHDSIFYLSSAESLSNGDGLSWIAGGGELKPLTHFPPLYPSILSALEALLGNFQTAAKFLATAFFAANVILVSISIYQLSSSTLLSIIGGGLALSSPILLDIHLETMTEPQFLTFALLSLLSMGMYLKTRDPRTFVFSAVLASLAFLTRYIGVCLVLTGMGSILLWSPERRRWRDTLIFGALSTLPNLLWYIRNFSQTGTLTNRVIGFHWITKDQLSQAVSSISTWLFPVLPSDRFRIILIGSLLVAGIALVYARRNWFRPLETEEGSGASTFRVFTFFGIAYVLLLFVSLTFFDASTPLTNRILSPLYLLALIVLVSTLQSVRGRRSMIIMAMVIGLVGVSYVYRSVEIVASSRSEGRGFNSKNWKNSDTMLEVIKFDPNSIIYSNEAFPIWFLSRIPAYWIPEKTDPVKALPRSDFENQMAIMRERLKGEDSALVLFHPETLRLGMPSYEEISFGLTSIYTVEDGEIFVGATIDQDG